MFLFLKCSECCYRTVILRYAGSSGPSPCQKRLILCNAFASPFSNSLLNGSSPGGSTAPGGGKGTTAQFHCPVLSHYYCLLLLLPVPGNPGTRQWFVTLFARRRSVVHRSWLREPLICTPFTSIHHPRTITFLFWHLHPPKKFDCYPFSLKYVEISFFQKQALEFVKPKLVPLFKIMTSEGLIQLFPSKAW